MTTTHIVKIEAAEDLPHIPPLFVKLSEFQPFPGVFVREIEAVWNEESGSYPLVSDAERAIVHCLAVDALREQKERQARLQREDQDDHELPAFSQTACC